MKSEEPNLWEDDEFVYISEDLIQFLPNEYREKIDSLKQKGEDALRIADSDIQGLVRLVNAIPTTASLSYIYRRLRETCFEPTVEAIFEHEMLTTAFIVTYARLFVESNGVYRMSANDLPNHLKKVHTDLMTVRHKRYAHNGSEKSIKSGLRINFDNSVFKINMQMSLGQYIGGRDEWGELIKFIDQHMHERLTKVLRNLKQKTGYDWTFPSGPTPNWIDDAS